MMNDFLLRNVAKHIQIDETESAYFQSLLTSKKVARKEMLLREGQPCNQLSYVQSGILRAYLLDKHAKESTIMFADADWWITDMYCFLNDKPAMMFLEVIADSHIIQISKANFEKLLIRIPKFERFFRLLMQNAYTREQLRTIENLTLSSEERYNNFLIKYPHISGIVTQKQIASYLGITPEFLSFIKKGQTKKKIS